MSPEKEEEIKREIITKEEREQYIRDQDLIAGKDMSGCRQAFFFFVLMAIALVIMFYFKNFKTINP